MMNKKSMYIRPSVKVLYLKDLMQSDLGLFSVEGDAGELAKENDLGDEMDDEGTWGYQDYSYIWVVD